MLDGHHHHHPFTAILPPIIIRIIRAILIFIYRAVLALQFHASHLDRRLLLYLHDCANTAVESEIE